MKKFLLWIALSVLVVTVLAILAVNLFLESAVKSAVETLGGRLTRVEVKLDKVGLSLLSGSGTFHGLIVGNPPGYNTPQAMSVGSASFSVQPASLLSDKVVIRYIHLESPQINLGFDLSGNNLSTILANVQSAAASDKTPGTNAPSSANAAQASKKLQVNELVITDAKVGISWRGSTRETSVTLPPILLRDLGTGPDGITSGELTKQLIRAIEQAAVKEAAAGFKNLERTAQQAAQDVMNEVGKKADANLNKLSRGIGDMLKK